MKKRILALVLVLVVIFSASCSGAIKSTDEQARVVGECGGNDVRYEELRYITLTCKAALADKYGEDIFSSASSEWVGEYAEELEEMVEEQICQNYASLETFEAKKIKTTDSVTKKEVREYVAAVIDALGGEEEYVAYLDECFMTDSVLRLNTALESCFYRYYGVVSAEWDKEAYDAVLAKDGFVRTMSIFIRNDEGESVDKNRASAESVRSEIAAGKPLSSFIGTKYNQDTGMCDYYFMEGYFDEAYEEAAFALEIGGISPVVETADGFYIIQRMALDEGYMLDNIDSLKAIYVECKMYETINGLADELDFELNSYGKSIDLWTME